MREKLIEILKAAPFGGKILDYWWFEETVAKFADYLIQNGTTIPVRCKDCRHCDPENRHCDHPMGTALPVPRKEDDFCSYGERRNPNG